ncbi:MAG TPA: hypothetical protein VN408_19330, partial [Actinoplanes sp.]|nr:hypothetical protein [Actinoplanes sp.]
TAAMAAVIAPVAARLSAEDRALLDGVLATPAPQAGPVPGTPWLFAPGPDGLDGAPDEAVVATVDGVDGVWRAWRRPAVTAGDAHRVYLVETGPDQDLPAIAARMQEALTAAGETPPRVEVYPRGAALPPYQRQVRAAGTLLWSRTPDPGVRVARIYDLVDERGPHLADDHTVLDTDEAARVLRYLNGGEPLLLGMLPLPDVRRDDRPETVPSGFATDGAWVWSDATAYYLDTYRLAPDEELLEHIRAAGYRVPAVDGAGLHRALAALRTPR